MDGMPRSSNGVCCSQQHRPVVKIVVSTGSVCSVLHLSDIFFNSIVLQDLRWGIASVLMFLVGVLTQRAPIGVSRFIMVILLVGK